MHMHLPIEQLLRREGMPFQFAFATEAKELVPQREDFLLNPSHKGLRVLARNEEALAAPVELLRELYGSGLQVEPPKVRLMGTVQVQEPIMHVAHQPRHALSRRREESHAAPRSRAVRGLRALELLRAALRSTARRVARAAGRARAPNRGQREAMDRP